MVITANDLPKSSVIACAIDKTSILITRIHVGPVLGSCCLRHLALVGIQSSWITKESVL